MKASLLVLCAALFFQAEGFLQAQPIGEFDFELRDLPGDIKYLEMREFYRNSERGTSSPNIPAEINKLLGPLKMIPQENVRFVYPWPVNAHSKDDPSKVVSEQYLKQSVFIFISGDPHDKAELGLQTGQVVIMTRPQNANAPNKDMLALSPYSTVLGLPKTIVQNRLCAPAKISTGSDGKERWQYYSEITQTNQTVQRSTSNTRGYVGDSGVNLDTVRKTPVRLSRTVVLWNFTLIFNADSFVEKIEQGNLGAGEWKQVSAP